MADNVIKAVFASGRRVKTAPLWRYDHGIRLQPIGLELPEHYEMHFSNSKTGEAKTVLADANGAVIPAEYLIPGTEVYAWIYLVGDSYGRTKAEIIIPVDAKAKPTDQEPTPEQQPIIEQAIDALNDAQDALEEATSHIIESGITPEEREKLAGIENGAEVNVIEEIRQYDPIKQKYVPLPVTDKCVDLPEIDFPKEVFYHPKFVVEEVDGRLAVTSADLNPSEVLNVVSLHEKVIISRTSFGGRDYYLRLVEAKTDPPGMSCCFSGEIDDGVFLRISDTDDALSWTATMFSAAEDDAVRQAFEEVYYAIPKTAADVGAVALNQGAANDGKVLMVGPDGMVAPQEAAGGDNVFIAQYGVTTQAELEAAYSAGKALFCDYVPPDTEGIIHRLSYFSRNEIDTTLHIYYFSGTESSNTGSIVQILASCGLEDLNEWQIETLHSPIPKPVGNPSPLGIANPGASNFYSRHDHVHQMPDASDVGAVALDGNAYRTASIPMGHLDSTSTATVMTAQVDGITELRDGVCVWLRNGVVSSASGVTLNINGLGAKPIYNSLSGAVVTTTFAAASTYLFVYNATRVTGGCWDMVYGYDANTTYTPVKLGFGYVTCSTAEATLAKTAALSSYTLTTGGIVAVKFTNAVPAGATLNINSKGAKAIYYRGAAITAGVIQAGDTVTMIYSTYYHILSIDRDETGITMTEEEVDDAVYSVDFRGHKTRKTIINNSPSLIKLNRGTAYPDDPVFLTVLSINPDGVKVEFSSRPYYITNGTYALGDFYITMYSGDTLCFVMPDVSNFSVSAVEIVNTEGGSND